MFKKLISLYHTVFKFIIHDIWHLVPTRLSNRKAFWVRQLKVFIFTIKEFDNNRVSQQASSLTLYTTMSIIPIAALVFAISKGFGIEEQITETLHNNFPDQKELVEWVVVFANSTIKNASGGWMAGVGILVLMWTSLNMFAQIEESFNQIWQAKRPRTWFRRFADYLSLMLIIPVLLLISGSMTITFEYYISWLDSMIPFTTISPIVFTVVPYLLIWLTFTILFMVMPNKRVEFVPAVIAAIVAGTAFQLLAQFYFFSQISLSKYNAIYGSLAAIPLFLFIAKISWQIILFGAELSYAHQNLDQYEMSLKTETLSQSSTELLSIYILRHIIKSFKNEEKAQSTSQIAHELGLSMRHTNNMIDLLLRCNLVIEVFTKDEKIRAYVPALDIHKIDINKVLNALSDLGGHTLEELPDLLAIQAILLPIREAQAQGNGQIKLLDL